MVKVIKKSKSDKILLNHYTYLWYFLFVLLFCFIIIMQLMLGCPHISTTFNKYLCKKKIYTSGEKIASGNMKINFITVKSFEQYDQPSHFYPFMLTNFQINFIKNELLSIDYEIGCKINTSETGIIQVISNISPGFIKPDSPIQKLTNEVIYENNLMNLTSIYYYEYFTTDDETKFFEADKICAESKRIKGKNNNYNVEISHNNISCNNKYQTWLNNSFDTNVNDVQLFSSYQCTGCFWTDKITGQDVILIIIGIATLMGIVTKLENSLIILLEKRKNNKKDNKSYNKSIDESSELKLII